jgi:hypothetical protein
VISVGIRLGPERLHHNAWEWAKLIRKLRWIGLEEEARLLSWQ